MEIVRGTTKTPTIKLKKNGDEYQIDEGDIIRFGVKNNTDDSEYLILKEMISTDYSEDAGGYPLMIYPEDTINLDVGSYAYDIGIQTAAGQYKMVKVYSPFKILPNVTRKENI